MVLRWALQNIQSIKNSNLKKKKNLFQRTENKEHPIIHFNEIIHLITKPNKKKLHINITLEMKIKLLK